MTDRSGNSNSAITTENSGSYVLSNDNILGKTAVFTTADSTSFALTNTINSSNLSISLWYKASSLNTSS